jgi:hypothetical protein
MKKPIKQSAKPAVMFSKPPNYCAVRCCGSCAAWKEEWDESMDISYCTKYPTEVMFREDPIVIYEGDVASNCCDDWQPRPAPEPEPAEPA